ncbi:MAG: rhodanese-like domain-containing protein [Candidatus Electrothrix sp. LOE1_4_5]|nr:rhodanese-like domain-containing protein [Candidatus Electrothrix gigas]
MKIKEISTCLTILALSLTLPVSSFAATDLKAGEAAFYKELRAAIPKDKIKNVDDLYAKWQEIQNGKSKAVIIDVRTEAEFDTGHILNSSNVDSGHAYGLYKKIQDPNAEIWVTCRTKHRASYFVGMLYKYGYTNVYIAEGGIKAWAEKGYPLANKYLGTIKVIDYKKKLKEQYMSRENK